jgi:hypothetical protein
MLAAIVMGTSHGHPHAFMRAEVTAGNPQSTFVTMVTQGNSAYEIPQTPHRVSPRIDIVPQTVLTPSARFPRVTF